MLGIVDISYASIILQQYSRVTPFLDDCGRILADTLKDEGIYGSNTGGVTTVIVNSLREVTPAPNYASSLLMKIFAVHGVYARW